MSLTATPTPPPPPGHHAPYAPPRRHPADLAAPPTGHSPGSITGGQAQVTLTTTSTPWPRPPDRSPRPHHRQPPGASKPTPAPSPQAHTILADPHPVAAPPRQPGRLPADAPRVHHRRRPHAARHRLRHHPPGLRRLVRRPWRPPTSPPGNNHQHTPRTLNRHPAARTPPPARPPPTRRWPGWVTRQTGPGPLRERRRLPGRRPPDRGPRPHRRQAPGLSSRRPDRPAPRPTGSHHRALPPAHRRAASQQIAQRFIGVANLLQPPRSARARRTTPPGTPA